MDSHANTNDWETYLRGLTPCHFPRFGRPNTDSGSVARIESAPVQIDGAREDAALQQLSVDDVDGLGAVLAVAWALLLRCYTGQDDTCFAFEHAFAAGHADGDQNRNRRQKGPQVARVVVADDAGNIAGVVGRAKTELAGSWTRAPPRFVATENSDLSMLDSAVVLWSSVGRSTPCPVLTPQHHKIRFLAQRVGHDHNGISRSNSLKLSLEWNSDALGMSAAQGARVASTLGAILSGVLLSPPETPLRDLTSSSTTMMSAANAQQVQAWNERHARLDPVARCIHDVIADRVRDHPYVQAKWTVVAMLAVMRAGGAFVPLDPSHPLDRLRGLCESVGAKLVLSAAHLAEKLAGVVDTVLPIDQETIAQATKGNAQTTPVSKVRSTNAAYVIFTSGSTGKPKGTLIEHQAFCSSARAHGPGLRIDGTCRVLQFAAHTFDASLVEILTPLMVGACVCIPDEHDRLNDLAGAINRMKVDHAVLTPSFINFLTPATVPGLRRLVLAGEAMSRTHVETWSHIELVNGYGPAESSVAAVVNSRVGPDSEATDIGMPCGVRVWIVDPENHNRLLPVGCVGEMLLEGPSLARGYLNDPVKTEDSFIYGPAWADSSERRFYKTGDLGRYNSDAGSLSYVGRKDTQIKLHGQRIELGEIEHHLAVDQAVQHALVLLPKKGPLAKRLITVVSLSDPAVAAASASASQSGDAVGVMKLTKTPSLTEPILESIRTRLGSRLPAYMVPSTWLCVESVPMLASRKMDRKTVSTWVDALTAEECQEMIRAQHTTTTSAGPEDNTPLSEVERTLRDIWSAVLNFPADQISASDRSFLSLGGDSISAMACTSHAKKARLGVSVQDVLKAKSLRQLAAVAKVTSAPTEQQVEGEEAAEKSALNQPFALTPIQQLHFAVRGGVRGDAHFNQSFCLRLARPVKEDAVRDAIRIVVQRHAMLRARFAQEEETGEWMQFITSEVETSYRLRAHTIATRADSDTGMASAQSCLNARTGPLLAAELFEVRDKRQQILFMTAHHLVIDLVSWRVVMEEVEELLDNPSSAAIPFHHSLPFRKWAALQIDDCSGKSLRDVLPCADDVPDSQFAYWGMQDRPNQYGDVACEGFDLDLDTSNVLLHDCHTPFTTEAIDLLLAALIWSFRAAFPDRNPPAIFNEGHGREPPKDDIDIARTVGWFTTLFPVALSSPTSLADALIQVKDLRRRVPGNGRNYFASRFHTAEGRKEWMPRHQNMEVSFNFLGRYQQLERKDGLFQPAEGATMAGEAHAGSPTADFGQRAPRFSLFEISAVVVQGVLRFGFAWNGTMQHQERIRQWVNNCRGVLVEAAATLPQMQRRTTAGDLNLIPGLSSADLAVFEKTKLALLTNGQGWDAVEDIYPTSAIQQGLLLSRTKDDSGSVYAVRRAFEAKVGEKGRAVDVQRLVRAWKQVVQHHALLRTVFVDALSQAQAGSHDQVVLRDVEPPMAVRQCSDAEEVHALVNSLEPMDYADEAPQHRLAVFHSRDTVACVLEMTHSIMDGASMDILLRDLGRAYQGSLEKNPKPLFRPFVASLQQRNLQSDVAFWKTHLSGVDACHFPVLNDGVNVPEANKALRTLRVSFPGLAKLQAFCSATGFTLPNAFHAAWALTLGCYTATDEVCFGYLVSGRDAATIEGSEDAVGPFINMATQRVKLEAESSLLRLLETVQKDLFECMPYAQVSLAEVQHGLQVPGGMSLFNTCISYRRREPNSPSNGISEDGLVCEDLGAIHDPTEYPISLNVETDDRGADIDLDYWTDAVAPEQAEHVAATFLQALHNMAENGHADTPLSKLDNVHAISKDRIWNWNANMPATTHDCLHHRVEQQVALRPQSQAIRGWDGDYTYAEMNAAANRLARHLRSLGVGPEVLVPVCLDKTSWTTIAMLAVLKAGGGVVPLDASHPASALEGKVEDAGANVVVASEARAGMFINMVPSVVAVGSALLARLTARGIPDDGSIDSGVTPENPAFIMFTSGSTGKPKGVVLCHHALVSSCLAHGAALGLGPHTRFLQFAAHTFDNSIEEMFTNLLHGGCVCVPSDADRLGDLPGAIARLNANFMDLTPTVAAMLRPEQVPSIRGMAVGGEALTREVLDAWGGVIPVHNQYGPSECSINSAHKLHLTADGDVGNIGKSVGSVSWVVDPKNHDRLVPVGCVGELVIEGPILGRGYLNRPVETAKAFIEMPAWATLDPYHAHKGDRRRMYKTGDLVRYNSDGSIIYLGRKDTQVKLHGQRIELGEIEHHVKSALPASAQSSVELIVPADGKKALAVFVLLQDDNDNDKDINILPMDDKSRSLAQSVLSSVASQVAAYMVPRLVFPVSRMPLTSSGKLDRRCLRTMAQDLALDKMAEYRLGMETTGGRAPETPMEKLLQELWSSVLRVPAASITADDSFAIHGGDSVGAMRLAASARQRGVVLTVATIFQSAKLSDMAASLAASNNNTVGAVATVESFPSPVEPFSMLKGTPAQAGELRQQVGAICQLDAESIEDIYPCTPLQAGLVAASQRQPGAYVAVNWYELPSNIDLARFRQAWQEVVDSEAILRTRVVFVEDLGFMQVVAKTKIEWTTSLTEEHRHLPPHDGGVLTRYTIENHATQQRPRFAWTAHHAVYDGWSLPGLLSRVEARYLNPGTPVPSVPHYSRFVQHLESLDASVSDKFWSDKLSAPGATHFPQLPHPGYRVQAMTQVTRAVQFTKPKSTLSTAALLRTAWALVVSLYASSPDIVFGEILNGRDVSMSGIEDLVGPTLASVPRRVRIDRTLTIQQFLADVQGQLNDVTPHQFAGLPRIRALGGAIAAACEFANLLAIDMADEMPDKDSLWAGMVGDGTKQGADFFNLPLNVTCTLGHGAAGEEVLLRAIFDAEVVPQWQVSRMLGQLETILNRLSAVDTQQQLVGDIDLLSAEDQTVLRQWNTTPGPLVERRVHEMISETLTRRGTSETAVIGWDARLSAGQLESLSTALAGDLVSRGVCANGKNRFVPFCFDKSAFAVVAILAVLKAGAAFVPLDPAHPVARLREIVGDCAAEVVLCSPRYAGRCAEVVSTVIPVDMGMLEALEAKRSRIAIIQPAPGDPAYVIFTSGTTGKPKGTIISHTAFCSGAAAHGPAMGMHPPFRFLQFASYTFDASLVEIITTLMLGGTVCVPREEDRTNGNIAAAMEEMGVTMTLLTPSFARVLDPSAVPTLKTLILGGEAMAPSHLATWADKLHLVNAYGPSECAVVATVNPHMQRTSNPANLGRGLGRCWIVDPDNHDRLAPVGSVGELLVEGPTLSSGYLRNEAKTREVFIETPRWAVDAALRFPDMDFSGGARRMYKTGDLVRICDDATGQMVYMGRKDASQAKLNGQRLELDEIVHHLASDEAVHHAIVVLPKTGPCAKRLVAVLSLQGSQRPVKGLELVITRTAASAVAKVQDRLREKLPAYMVPSTWLVLEGIPLLPSGKLDRNSVAKFVDSLSEEALDKIANASEPAEKVVSRAQTTQVSQIPQTPQIPLHETLKTIWSQVLNISPDRIGPNVSFLHLGGDSITAMQVMAKCRGQGIRVAVSDIIGSKSVHELALKVQPSASQQTQQLQPVSGQKASNSEDHHEFDPSPIQQLFFQAMHVNPSQGTSQGSHFNQSVLLRLAKKTNAHDLARGLHALVESHSMLRARFRRDGLGHWRQRITTDVSGSYRFKTHSLRSVSRMEKRIRSSQTALDFERGPLMAADWFSITGQEDNDENSGDDEVYVFIAVHHLVVDVVSWGILLQDLEDFLATGSIKAPPSLSFQTWTRQQSERAQDEKNRAALLPRRETADADLAYWGMAGGASSNAHGDVLHAEAVELDVATTAQLLGADCHAPMGTEVLDVLLAALLLSYRNATDGRRGVPTIYNEGHGREVWDGAMDVSRTIGWFTTLYPVHLPDESSSDDDLITAVRWVKDYRARLAGKGRPYFAYRMLTADGRAAYDKGWPVEVAFNYLGQMQNLSRTDNFLQAADHSIDTSDVGNSVPRLALIEVSAVVANGQMTLSFAYNKHMKHHDSIHRWVRECQSLLSSAPHALAQHSQAQTLSAFPLLSLSYYGLDSLEHRLQEAGVALREVEDIYPCSPMQRGLLLSQMRDPHKYGYSAVFEVESSLGKGVDAEKLSSAWQAVVRRHATLRTIFVDAVGDEGLMDQVVLREATGRVQLLEMDSEDAIQTLQSLDNIDYRDKIPPHRLSICTHNSTGQVVCRLDISHTISDGSSMPILLDDLAAAYGNDIINKPVPAYREYIAHLQAQPRAESLGYWKGYLSGAEPCLFPVLSAGQQQEKDENNKESLGAHMLTLENPSQIQAYCRSSGVTLSTLLQLAWALVVRSYTGSDEVLFGYLASGRDIPVPHMEHAVGALINMLVCRLQLPAEAEVGDVLETMRADLAGALAHPSCSLAEMQHAVQTPVLFNTAFTYQRRTGSGSEQKDQENALRYQVLDAHDPSEYTVAVNVEATDAAVEIHFSYWRHTVSDTHIQHIGAAFAQAVADLVSENNDNTDDRTIGDVSLVGPAAIQQIRAWNDYDLPRVEQCVHDLVSQHVLSHPDSPAVCGWDASFTYAELDRAATALARRLVNLDIGPEVFVPLCFDKSAWTVVAQLGVLKAGGAFVNLDPSFPETRLQGLVEDVGASVVLCSEQHREKMAKIAETVMVVDEGILTANPNPVHFTRHNTNTTPPFISPALPSNPAYVIFTSGTTGKPKGTVVEHGAFSTGALAHAAAMFMHRESRVLQFASYTFDASIMETLSCLLVGGCVCVPSDEARMDDVAAVIRDMRVTWTLLTPSVASTLRPERVACLQTLVTGGEAMAPGHIERWGTRCALVNAYGPTECSVVATTSTKVDEARRVCDSDRANIGAAVGGRVWVVDAQDYHRLVPVGAVGELVVEGRLVARGYLNNKEQTAKVFVRSPAWTRTRSLASLWKQQQQYTQRAEGPQKMYRTGDLVRYNADGTISYISRKDTQIKLNGRRIELGEMEFHCRAGLPSDAQSAVEVVNSAGSKVKTLAAFFCVSRTTNTAFSMLPLDDATRNLALAAEAHMAAQLPSYMVPQLFVHVSAMPWTTAGKLDRRQLRNALEQASREVVSGYRLSKVAPGTSAGNSRPASETEKKLQALWESVLGLSAGSVSAGDSFFRLGGDSLTAMRLVGAARAHKMNLTVLNVFEKPVLADMARVCGGAEVSVAPVADLKPFSLVQGNINDLLDLISSQCQVAPEQIQDMYPCSPLQEGLVTLASTQAGAYVAIHTLSLPDDIDIRQFRAAWQTVVDETDIPRTRILHTGASGFLQVVTAPEPIQWHEDVSLEDATAQGQSLGSQTGGPLTRFAIVRKPDGSGHDFVWGIHHALYDGWSMRLLAQRVQDVYHSLVSGTQQATTTTSGTPYAHFIRYLAGRDQNASEAFWKASLHGASVSHFPQPAHRRASMNKKAPSFRVETRAINLGSGRPRSGILTDITPPTLVRAAWAVLLAAYTGVDDVIFGETLAGRNIDLPGASVSAADISGPTFSTVPTRVNVDSRMSLVDFFKGLHTMAGQVVPHQHLGLQRIAQLEGCAAACGFQNLLVIQTASQGQGQNTTESTSTEWDFDSASNSFFTHPLVVECTASESVVEATFHYDETVLSSWHARRMIHQLDAVLQRLVKACESDSDATTLGDIHALSPEDQSLLSRWRRSGKTSSIVDQCIERNVNNTTGNTTAWWVVDVRDNDNNNAQLAPIGATGELAIGGNTPTAATRTGELVRYRPDGSLEHLGRKDSQVQVHGQRLALADVENQLAADRKVTRAAVVQPNRGACKKMLVAVVTLARFRLSSSSSRVVVLDASTESMAAARSDVDEIRTRLQDRLPHYMVPGAWIVLEAMPSLSGALDREELMNWVEELSEEEYDRIASLGLKEEDEEEVDGPVKTLREIWAKELNVPVGQIKLNEPFLALGGDSIRAMGVVSRARLAHIKLSVQDVLRAGSVVHLTQLAKSLPSGTKTENTQKTDTPFALSPIQTLYFQSAQQYGGHSRFNQSITLGVSRSVSTEAIKKALGTLVQRHGMLRARFTKKNLWEQQYTKAPSYCAEHHIRSRSEIPAIVATAQASLSPEHGPVFRADLLSIPGQDTIVSLVAHHLCIDIVSWRIIVQDLTQLLEGGALPDTPLSFQAWCAQQAAHNKTVNPTTLLPFEETTPDLSYWNARGPFTYGRTKTETFALDATTTGLALGASHKAFRSEPVDLILAAIVHAFSANFTDRNVPTLHMETHGREAPEGSGLDLTQTVGWFTTICPLVVASGTKDALDTLRRTKDARRSIPQNGRPYFAHKYLGASNKAWAPMEILFNYLGGGVGQQQENNDDTSLVRSIDLDLTDLSTADVGPETQRLALFEISAAVVHNKLQFTFVYDSALSRSPQILRWIRACKDTLAAMARTLAQHPEEPTLSDYPRLPLTYASLRTLTDVALPRAARGLVARGGNSVLAAVEDMYPCTPVQEGMLISQLRNPDAYVFHAVYRLAHTRGDRLNAQKLAKAWQTVVDRHAALRTLFVESVRRGGVFDQVVLRKADCCAVLLQSTTDAEAAQKLAQVTLRSATHPLPHQLALCTTSSGAVLLKLEVNHAIIDGGSLAIILGELAAVYTGTLQVTPAPLYSDYVQHIVSKPADQASAYWRNYLQGLAPCHVPNLDLNNSSALTLVAADPSSSSSSSRSLNATTLPFARYTALRQLSARTHVTLANIMHTAWALVLRAYTGADDVCFGYLTAGRDAPVENIARTVGTLINMLCCRVRVSSVAGKQTSLEEIVRQTQEEYLQSLQFQHCSLALVQHELGMAGRPLYNTSISIQNHGEAKEEEDTETLVFDMEKAHDPSEYAITVNIETSPGSEGCVLRYWSDLVGDEQAQQMARTMGRILDAFVDQPRLSIGGLDAMLQTLPTRQAEQERSIDNTESDMVVSLPSSPLPNMIDQTAGHMEAPEQILLSLWSTLLDRPTASIAAHDSFFDLGGDSITAMRLAGEARDSGLSLTVADVFRAPTFDAMLGRIHASMPVIPVLEDVPEEDLTPDLVFSPELDSGGTLTPLTPLSLQTTSTSTPRDSYERFSLLAAVAKSNVDAFLQARIVPQVCVFRGGISDVLPATDFQALSVAGALLESRWMLNSFYLDGSGPLNLVQLKRACFALVQAFDILRTVFVPSGGRFLQVVLRTLRPAFRVIETESPLETFQIGDEKSQGEDNGEKTEMGDSENDSDPQLGEPFVAFTVVKHLPSRRHRLYLRLSHAQYDGVCFPKILAALQAAYQGETVPRPPTFAHYLRASAGALTSEHYQHWTQLLAGASMTEIVRRQGPNYRGTSTKTTTTTLKQTVRIPPITSGGITTATVVKAAWAYVLAQASATSDVVFGHTISGRNAAVPGVANMVGPCLNLVPVRVRFHDGSEDTDGNTEDSAEGITVRALLRQVQDQQVANMAHEVLGFREIIRHCTPWPRWTTFASTVQHQNLEGGAGGSGQTIRMGGVEYTFGCASTAQEEFADIAIFSQPAPVPVTANNTGHRYNNNNADHFEIMLSFADGGPVPRIFADRALDLLCRTAQRFASNPDLVLPSAADLCTRCPQLPFELPLYRTSKFQEETNTESGLEHLNNAQVEELTAFVGNAWREVLDLPETDNVSVEKTTSFFALGGDIIGLAQLAWLLSHPNTTTTYYRNNLANANPNKPPPRLEELIETPTLAGQMALLARNIPAGVPDSITAAPESVPGVPGMERTKSMFMLGGGAAKKMKGEDGSSRLKLGRAMGLVKKRLQGRKGDVQIVE
ncbi:hypothetical protein B0J18DRAFT_409502 [Chaetomium sp. MPI-SDFR-AT-0129]|nr:hypothetical protein B0J18DRAFT_409502 [Chaetomium sp. MPI-SDFR-AT-0129]